MHTSSSSAVLGLPAMPYDGPEPDGYAHYREVLGWVERYAAHVGGTRA